MRFLWACPASGRCASPTARRARCPPGSTASLEAATAPEVDGPRIATTLLSAMYFCASACAGAGPCSTGVSPRTSLTFSPYCGASVLTAYFAQLACSAPRKPAPPVSGVMNGERDRAVAVERRRLGRRNLLASLRARRHHRRGEHREGEADGLLHLVPPCPGGHVLTGGVAPEHRVSSCPAGVNDQITAVHCGARRPTRRVQELTEANRLVAAHGPDMDERDVQLFAGPCRGSARPTATSERRTIST